MTESEYQEDRKRRQYAPEIMSFETCPQRVVDAVLDLHDVILDFKELIERVPQDSAEACTYFQDMRSLVTAHAITLGRSQEVFILAANFCAEVAIKDAEAWAEANGATASEET